MPLENSQTQSAAVYGADQSNYGYDTSQTYYQETAPSQMQPSGPSSAYGGNYQPPSRSPYGAYGTPAPYQPLNIFLPSHTPSQGKQIRKHIDGTLGSGNLREAVKLPIGEDLNEWLAVNRICAN
ncbi:hypothetical protein ACB092_09G129800 [Castanea dentata]